MEWQKTVKEVENKNVRNKKKTNKIKYLSVTNNSNNYSIVTRV